MDPVESARDAADLAIKATKIAAVALRRASEREAEATAQYDDDDAKAEHAAVGRLAREKAERLHAKRVAEETDARAVLAAAELEEKGERYDTLVTFIGNFPTRLRPLLEALIALDREAARIVDQVADAVIDTQDLHDVAAQLATQLGRLPDFGMRAVRPTMLDAKLLACTAVHMDRKAQARDDVDGWTQGGKVPAWDSPLRPGHDAAVATLVRLGFKGDDA